MKILIVEDEDLAVKKILKTLNAVDPTAEVAGITDSIESTVAWINSNDQPDLILMDIELADGQSFEIFNLVEIKCPVVFTTSYDEFALKAFKVNTIDYLLKPVQKEELDAAINKYKKLHADKVTSGAASTDAFNMDVLVKELQKKLQLKEYRKRFLVKLAQKLVSIEVEDICYF